MRAGGRHRRRSGQCDCRSAATWAKPADDGIHLLGALAGKVLRVSPPMTMTEAEAQTSLALFHKLIQDVAQKLQAVVDQSA